MSTTTLSTTYDASPTPPTLSPNGQSFTNGSGDLKILIAPAAGTTMSAVSSTACSGSSSPALTWGPDPSNPGQFVSSVFSMPALNSQDCFQITVTASSGGSAPFPHDPKFTVKNKRGGG